MRQTTTSDQILIKRLRECGEKYYHHSHPFHQRMHAGELSRIEIQSWIRNRFAYQAILPVKDSIILSKLPGTRERRLWIKRVIEHDGTEGTTGGIDAWIGIGAAAGIARHELVSLSGVHPVVREAVDSYVLFCQNKSWVEAVASSLTELFAPRLIADRMKVFEEKYPWLERAASFYFTNRLSQAALDSEQALDMLIGQTLDADKQDQIVDAVKFKCNLLWKILDGTELDCKWRMETASIGT